MTRIKLCGMMRDKDIKTANDLGVDYIGFVFAKKSRRYVSPEQARRLKELLSPQIRAVGVFVNEPPEKVAALLLEGIIDLAQLHGEESEEEIQSLRETGKPIIRAFQVRSEKDLWAAEKSSADHILLDAGAGDGALFDWKKLEGFERPYFLAGGLDPENVLDAIRRLHPYGVDVSSGIETEGKKDPKKMKAFAEAVQKADTM